MTDRDTNRKKTLELVDSLGSLDTLELAEKLGCDHQAAVGTVKSLKATDEDLLTVVDKKEVHFQPTDEGKEAGEKGSPEARAFAAVPAEGIAKGDFDKATAALGKMAAGQCMKNKWLTMDKSGGAGPVVKRVVDSIEDSVGAQLKYMNENKDAMTDTVLSKGPSGPISLDVCKQLIKRQLVKKTQITAYVISKGPGFSLTIKEQITDLTPEMLLDGSWKTANFRKFNLAAAPRQPAGALHPLLKVRSEFRRIFLEMGFSEMPTNNPGFIESSFWNFDALFQPQQHPARDAHDTFFMSNPATSKDLPEEYLQRVKTMHEKGGSGSIGYRYDWSRDEANKNILRTHTTAVSTRMLYQLGQQKEFKPCKMFSIDRVFRNETLDATHLAEFHQVEGLVADYNLTLGNLVGMLNLFFTKLGMTDIKFKPAYNPYTEPSMEIFAYHPDLKKEVEVGNSGIFRPEMLQPMGLPEDVCVIAWGLSVERPTMIKYGYNNIRDLFGASVDLKLVRDNPICRV